MTYPPGGPGYPTTQPPSQYSAPTQQFERPGEQASAIPAGPSKLPVYLGAAVAALALAVYLTSFGPLFDGRGGVASSFLLVIAPLLAGLVAGVGLLPKQDDRSGITAVLAVLGFLLIIVAVLGGDAPVGWAFYPFIVFSVFQAVAAVWQVLLASGVVTAPVPRPKPEPAPYGAGPYGAPPQYYGQPQGQSYGGPPQQQQPSYQPQYGGYQGAQGTSGFPSLGRPSGPANGPQSGPPTPPTGFPAFGQPQAAQPSAGVAQQSADSQQTQVTSQQQPSQQSAPPPS